jgi:hypothetical protein
LTVGCDICGADLGLPKLPRNRSKHRNDPYETYAFKASLVIRTIADTLQAGGLVFVKLRSFAKNIGHYKNKGL